MARTAARAAKLGPASRTEEGGSMSFERSYGTYEEFEREELRRDRCLDVTYEELLGEFVDDGWRGRERAREGLFDAHGDDGVGQGLDD